MSEKNIFQRINAVQAEVSYVQKDANIDNKYMAVSHDAVTAAVRESCVKHGIVITPDIVGKGEMQLVGETKYGTSIYRYTAMYEISFINIDDPQDKHRIKGEAQADDMGDKAPGKALSYAVKNAMLKTFLLETGENDESRVEIAAKKSAKIDQDKVNWINKTIEDKGINIEAFNSHLDKNRITSIENMTQAQFVDIERMLNNSRGTKNA